MKKSRKRLPRRAWARIADRVVRHPGQWVTDPELAGLTPRQDRTSRFRIADAAPELPGTFYFGVGPKEEDDLGVIRHDLYAMYRE